MAKNLPRSRWFWGYGGNKKYKEGYRRAFGKVSKDCKNCKNRGKKCDDCKNWSNYKEQYSVGKQIRMCVGQEGVFDCPLKEECLRYLMAPDEDRGFLQGAPYSNKLGECKFFIPAHEY